jgi:hypothetical protein
LNKAVHGIETLVRDQLIDSWGVKDKEMITGEHDALIDLTAELLLQTSRERREREVRRVRC